MKEKKSSNNIEFYEEDEIDLYELWLILKKRKLIIILTVLIFVIFSLIYAFIIAKPVYKSEAKILPLAEKNGELSRYKAIAESLGIFSFSCTKSEKLMAILNSDTLKIKVIERLNLLPVLYSDLWDIKEKKWLVDNKEDIPDIRDGLKILKDLINVSEDKKTGVITISVDYPEDPRLAYTILNTFINEAKNLVKEKSFSTTHRYRVYLEKQLFLVKRKVDLLEKIYIKYMKGEIKTVPYIFNLEENDVENFSFNEGEIKKTKIRLKNIGKKLNREEIYNSLPEKRINLERLNLQYSLLKDVFTRLYKEYEIAKLQEKREALAFDIIDEPYIPKKPYKPKKKLIVAVASISGLFLGIFIAFFIEWLENAKSNYKHRKDILDKNK